MKLQAQRSEVSDELFSSSGSAASHGTLTESDGVTLDDLPTLDVICSQLAALGLGPAGSSGPPVATAEDLFLALWRAWREQEIASAQKTCA